MNYDRDTLIYTHMSLAKNIALREWRTAPHALEKEEMESLAYWGLLNAAERWIPYCAERGYSPEALQYFKVFAALRIRGAIRDFIRQMDPATRTLRSKAKKLKEAGQDDGATVDELSERTGMSIAEINKVVARLATIRPFSLDAYVFNAEHAENPSSKGGNGLRDPVDTEGSAFANDMNNVFISTFKVLPDSIKIVLVLHYYSRLDLRAIAEELNLSESKVSQLHRTGVLSVKDALTKAAREVH